MRLVSGRGSNPQGLSMRICKTAMRFVRLTLVSYQQREATSARAGRAFLNGPSACARLRQARRHDLRGPFDGQVSLKSLAVVLPQAASRRWTPLSLVPPGHRGRSATLPRPPSASRLSLFGSDQRQLAERLRRCRLVLNVRSQRFSMMRTTSPRLVPRGPRHSRRGARVSMPRAR
jgi:hypothetical protein